MVSGSLKPLALVALVGALVAAIASPTRAREASPALALARMAVAEAGWVAHRDHAAMWHVVARRAGRAGWTVQQMAYTYSSPLRRGKHWALGLPPWASDVAPPGLPARVGWPAHRLEWERLLRAAQAFTEGAVGDPCRGRAWHWGDRAGDRARAVRAGFHAVGCGPTLNLFWAPPSAGPARAFRSPNKSKAM